MKTYLFTGLLTFGLLLSAATRLSAEDVPALPATAEGLLQEMIKSIGELSTLMEGIKDEKGVEAAKGSLTQIMQRQFKIAMALEKLGKPTPEVKSQLNAKYDAQMDAAKTRLAAQRERLNAYPTFQKTMNEIIAAVQKEP